MRWLRFKKNGVSQLGVLEGDTVTEVTGDMFGEYQLTEQTHPLASLELDIPLMPRNFYCVGLNYMQHIKDVGYTAPTQPDIGYRAHSALIAHGQPVLMPPDATQVHYEGELVVVIGKQVKHVRKEDVRDCIFGYTIGNDVSERVWQKSDRTFWRSKNTDTFKPMGPWVTTDIELSGMETTVSVNGKVTTHFRTLDMLFGIERYISTMTRYLTLYPGDVIWMGTDGHSPDLQDGDRVDIHITGLGTLSNEFRRLQE